MILQPAKRTGDWFSKQYPPEQRVGLAESHLSKTLSEPTEGTKSMQDEDLAKVSWTISHREKTRMDVPGVWFLSSCSVSSHPLKEPKRLPGVSATQARTPLPWEHSCRLHSRVHSSALYFYYVKHGLTLTQCVLRTHFKNLAVTHMPLNWISTNSIKHDEFRTSWDAIQYLFSIQSKFLISPHHFLKSTACLWNKKIFMCF